MKALISVSDKTGIVEFAKELEAMGVEIISTGGTYKKLKEEGYLLAVISNKPQEGTNEVCKQFFSEINFDCVFGQREGVKVKPDRECVDLTLKDLGVSASEAIFVANEPGSNHTGQHGRRLSPKASKTKSILHRNGESRATARRGTVACAAVARTRSCS